MLRISLLLCIIPAFSIIVKDPPPSPSDYKYSYNVEDPSTGDSKSQHEVRRGDVVTGAYTVLGPDGTKRTVEYTADAKNGFKAVVSEESVNPPTPVTQPPVVQPQPVTSYDLLALQYPTTTARPVYAHIHPNTNYIEENPTVYFTPQSEIELRVPYSGGNYFIPANEY